VRIEKNPDPHRLVEASADVAQIVYAHEDVRYLLPLRQRLVGEAAQAGT
jgi:hypothetical protein